MHLLRLAGVRLALAYGGLFGFSALALVLGLWGATAALLNGQVDAAIRADAQGLAERWQEGGPAALLATIRSRVTGQADEEAIYLVLDPAGRSIAGNLRAWPAGVAQVGAIYELPVERGGVTSPARLHRFALPGGYALLVGRNMGVRAALRQVLTDTLAWALLVIVVLGVAGALVVQRMFRRMIGRVSATAAAFAAGDLAPRIPLVGRGDEFDQLAATVNTMLDRIVRLMDGVRSVSNAIAHDLRTPIARARARLEDAAAHAQDTPALRAAIDTAVADLDGVASVFQALLRIAEIEAGARQSAFGPVDAGPLLAGMVELYGPAAEEHGLSLVLDAPAPVMLWGDAGLVQQAVANLLDNAIKFSPPGGRVVLSAAVDAGWAVIRVQDAGPGIPAADRARATERFFRGAAARSTPGFGLGLALVGAVATLHQGALRLMEAAPGLLVELRLPLTETPHG